jgi:hypothetical protein
MKERRLLDTGIIHLEGCLDRDHICFMGTVQPEKWRAESLHRW